MDDIFAVQDEITESITTALDVQLVTGDVARHIRKSLRNPVAIENYYRGWGALFHSSHADIHYALQMAENTIASEPESPLGYSLGALSHWWSVAQNASADPPASLSRAAEWARRAIALKDSSGLPQLVMAQVHLWEKKHAEALAASEQSVQVRPNCHASFAIHANVLNYMSRWAEAVEPARFAIRLNPSYPPFYATILATAYYGCQRYEEALSTAALSLDIDSGNLDASVIKVAAIVALERTREAKAAAKEIVSIDPGFSLDAFAKTQPYQDPRALESMLGMLKKAGLG